MPAEGYPAMPRQAKRSYESMDDDSESGTYHDLQTLVAAD